MGHSMTLGAHDAIRSFRVRPNFNSASATWRRLLVQAGTQPLLAPGTVTHSDDRDAVGMGVRALDEQPAHGGVDKIDTAVGVPIRATVCVRCVMAQTGLDPGLALDMSLISGHRAAMSSRLGGAAK